jgi:hypothetical protein
LSKRKKTGNKIKKSKRRRTGPIPVPITIGVACMPLGSWDASGTVRNLKTKKKKRQEDFKEKKKDHSSFQQWKVLVDDSTKGAYIQLLQKVHASSYRKGLHRAVPACTAWADTVPVFPRAVPHYYLT